MYIFLFLLVPVFVWGAVDGLHLSSKVMCQALRAQELLERSREESLKGVQELEQLIVDSSFRRLELHEQVHILFVLSKGYERLGLYAAQEKLLSSYAHRREFYRYSIPFRVALLRSYLEQDRLHDAENLLKKIIGTSCSHLSRQEQSEIAGAIACKEEYVTRLLETADKNLEAGRPKEALRSYLIVLESVDAQHVPYQASPVERKKMRHLLLLRIGEAFFSLREFSRAVQVLKLWDDLFVEEAVAARRLFLLANCCEQLDDIEQAEHWYEQYSNCKIHVENRVEFVYWKARRAIEKQSLDGIKGCIEELSSNSKAHPGVQQILRGFVEYFEGDIVRSVDSLFDGIEKLGSHYGAWKETAAHLLLELGWQRVVLLLSSKQKARAEQLAKKIFARTFGFCQETQSHMLAAYAFFLSVGTRDKEYIDALQLLLNRIEESEYFVRYLLDHRLNEAFSVCVRKGRLVDLLFCAYLKNEASNCQLEPFSIVESRDLLLTSKTNSSACLGIQEPSFLSVWMDRGENREFLGEIAISEKSLLGEYLHAVFCYTQALDEGVGYEKVKCIFEKLLQKPYFEDIHEQIVQCLVRLALHAQDYEQAYLLINESIEREDMQVIQTVLSCIFAFESNPAFVNEYAALCQYIYDRPLDVHAFVLAAHLIERGHIPFEHTSCALRAFESAIFLWEEMRGHVKKAKILAEPSEAKDHILDAMEAYDQSRKYFELSIQHVLGQEEQAFVWSSIFRLHHEVLESLCQALMSDVAFNELPVFIQKARVLLRDDLHRFPSLLPNWRMYLHEDLITRSLVFRRIAQVSLALFANEYMRAFEKMCKMIEAHMFSSDIIRTGLFLAKKLRENGDVLNATILLNYMHEREILARDVELSLEIAMEKSLTFWAKQEIDRAMSMLAWVINGPYASSQRVRAMIVRADFYLAQHRYELAARQLESVAAKGGEWAVIADRKLREMYGIN